MHERKWTVKRQAAAVPIAHTRTLKGFIAPETKEDNVNDPLKNRFRTSED